MKKTILKMVSYIIAIITLISTFSFGSISASAASSNISSGVKGISIKVDNTTLTQGEKLSITPVLDSYGKRITKKITATINGKTYTLNANKKSQISLPKTLKSYSLNVKFTFNVKLPVSQAPKKTTNQNYATISQTITIVKNLSSVVSTAKKTYAEGSKLHYISKYRAYQCHAFAVFMSDTAFGAGKASPSNKSYKYIYATSSSGKVSSIRPGDIVRYRNGGYDHSIFVLRTDSKYVYYADCNGDGKETVRYNQKILRTTLEKYMKKKLVDRSISTYGYIAHYEYNYI